MYVIRCDCERGWRVRVLSRLSQLSTPVCLMDVGDGVHVAWPR
jgi:hypothetical protein